MAEKKKAVKTAQEKKPRARKTAPDKKVAVKRPRRRPAAQPPAALPSFEPQEQKIEESKYYAGPVIQKLAEERPAELPSGYGDNRIVLMVRDPFWLYTYWEVNDARRQEIAREVGTAALAGAREFLRVYDTGDWRSFDIEVHGARSWYFKVPAPNRSYCVDIGFLLADGRFITAARSNWVTTPLDRMSDVIDEQWLTPDWERLYALSGGFGIGRSSGEIREMIKKRFSEENSSGWLSSFGSPVRKMGERPFWLVANCELIVYGATEPTATVTVQGHQIDLREDGTFSLRFTLPDGQQVIPIEAIRDDGAERRKITPIVGRKTE